MIKNRTLTKLSQGMPPAKALRETSDIFTSPSELSQQLQELEAHLQGPGIQLQTLINNPQITDILITNGWIWVEEAGTLKQHVTARLEETYCKELATRLAALAGSRLDEAKPIADGTLPDGTRLNAVIPPLSVNGTSISLRTTRKTRFTLADLAKNGMFTPNSEYLLRRFIQLRASVLISGATGSGKTTLLGAVITQMPHNQRIITIEDTAELRPDHPHIVSLLAKQANIQGKGAVSLAELVQTALRMRPDRIVLGECRGSEIRDLFAALNTGHQGSWGTLHANSVFDVPARLFALGALAGMNESMVAAQALAGIDVLVHVGKVYSATGTERRVLEIGRLEAGGVNGLKVVKVWDLAADQLDGEVLQKLEDKLGFARGLGGAFNA